MSDKKSCRNQFEDKLDGVRNLQNNNFDTIYLSQDSSMLSNTTYQQQSMIELGYMCLRVPLAHQQWYLPNKLISNCCLIGHWLGVFHHSNGWYYLHWLSRGVRNTKQARIEKAQSWIQIHKLPLTSLPPIEFIFILPLQEIGRSTQIHI